MNEVEAEERGLRRPTANERRIASRTRAFSDANWDVVAELDRDKQWRSSVARGARQTKNTGSATWPIMSVVWGMEISTIQIPGQMTMMVLSSVSRFGEEKDESGWSLLFLRHVAISLCID